MNISPLKVERALLSVSDKTGIVDFARVLYAHGVAIMSTGGTAKVLRAAGLPIKDVSEYTGFPEIMDGRVKTLHPRVHGGILGRRDIDSSVARAHNIEWIDLVVCNLYPFQKTTADPACTEEQAREQIDIGGPSMIRSGAKNYEWACVVVDPADYVALGDSIQKEGISFDSRKLLAAKAFAHTAAYDSAIANYFSSDALGDSLVLTYTKHLSLRYGENPHQRAAFYGDAHRSLENIFKQHQGKELSYNNILDADAALRLCAEFHEPACVIVKHTNPCGVAVASSHEQAFRSAYAADSLSAFGGIIALNGACTTAIAQEIVKSFFEVLIAPSYESEALELLQTKKNLRVLTLVENNNSEYEYRSALHGLLVQQNDNAVLDISEARIVTNRKPSDEQMTDLSNAWKVVKHTKSNAIVVFKDGITCGIGSGLVSRIDSVRHAIQKCSGSLSGTVLASDAFFPFRDSIEYIASAGVQAIIQPGGSLRDKEVIDACNEFGISMVFTGIRCFRH